MFSCIFSGGASAFGLFLLSRAATKTPHRRASFFAVAELTYPKAAIFFDAAIAIKCFGVSIRWAIRAFTMTVRVDPLHLSYLIIIKGLMPNVVAAIHHDIASPDTRLPDWTLSSRVWICLIMLILAPFAFLRRLNSLRHTSFIAIFAIGTRASPQPPDHPADSWLNKHILSLLWYIVTSTPWKALRNQGQSISFTLPPRSCRLSQSRCSLSPVLRT
jgi:amino acid permease